MLKNRLIPCIITKGNLVVQSYNFERYLPIGDVKTAIEYFVNWDVDEIIILDIDASKERRGPNVALIEWAATECFVPLTIGGGIRTIQDIRSLLSAGADKVAVNSHAFECPDFIKEAAGIFGSQCITASIDARQLSGNYFAFDHRNKKNRCELITWVNQVADLGAGEILLNSVDRDGSRIGYDLELLQQVSMAVSIPVIACGGVGRVSHLSEGILRGKCQAVAAANIFQHTEHSTIAAKSHMLKSGVDVRLNSDVRFEEFEFDRMGRPL